MQLNEIIEKWLNEENYVSLKNISKDEVLTKFENFHPSLLAGNQETSALSSGVFLGEYVNTGDTGLDIYTKFENLPTAVASILNKVQVMSDFFPQSQSEEEIANKYPLYVECISRTPFFHLMSSEVQEQDFKVSNYDVLINQIMNIYEGIRDEDRKKIETSIRDMAKSLASKRTKRAKLNLFSQSTIDLRDVNSIHLYIYDTVLETYEQADGKGEIGMQSYTVRKSKFVVLKDLIKAHADKLSTMDQKSVDDWLNDIKSPVKKDIQLCF